MAAAGFGSLRRRDDFARLRRGRRAVSGPLSMRYVPEGDELLVAFGIPKAFGNAPKRNRMRRRLRAAVRQVVPGCAGLSGCVLITARSSALEAGFDELVGNVEHLFRTMSSDRP